MDKRLVDLIGDETNTANWIRGGGVRDGFQFAIERLRANKYYDHYAYRLADWLEKHLTEDVPDSTATSLKGDKK